MFTLTGALIPGVTSSQSCGKNPPSPCGLGGSADFWAAWPPLADCASGQQRELPQPAVPGEGPQPLCCALRGLCWTTRGPELPLHPPCVLSPAASPERRLGRALWVLEVCGGQSRRSEPLWGAVEAVVEQVLALKSGGRIAVRLCHPELCDIQPGAPLTSPRQAMEAGLPRA